MADQHTYKFLPEDKCLTESQLFDYIDGKLKTSDMHFIEKHILSCGFCSDALEGLEKVKNRDKVAAFIPLEKEEKKEPKVIPLNPNRKYYALAAGIVLILGITLFLKLSTSNDLSESKMADIVNKDSSVSPQKNASAENGFARHDFTVLAEEADTDTKNASGEKIAGENETYKALEKSSGNAGPGYFDIAPATDRENAPTLKSADQSIVYDKNGDADGADDFVNIVDAKAVNEEARLDNVKDEAVVAKPQQKQSLAEKKNTPANNRAEKVKTAKEDQELVTVERSADTNTSLTLSSGGVVMQGTSSAPTNATVWTVPASTGQSTNITTTDSIAINTKSPSERELDLSYENGNKMLAAGQATASLALYDEVLKNPAHPHYKDAQWKKAEALIQLKRIDEAQKLLNEIAAKPGKYKEQAKKKLKEI